MNYQEAGVNIEKGDQFTRDIGSYVKATYNEKVVSGVGGFAALYDQGDSYLVAGTDGVGTKLMLARELGDHTTIGQDLVAMCVNDILCTGAMPLFFLDYLATGILTPSIHHEVVRSIAEACLRSRCALIGGETAEMPGCYEGADYDLAGFAVGQIAKDKVVDGSKVEVGMSIVGLPSSGFHSNGYSLLRRLLSRAPDELKKHCLTPTRIYRDEVEAALKTGAIFGMAHITGGGLHNIHRINENFGYRLNTLPATPSYMAEIFKISQLETSELIKTFNMGMGFCFITHSPQKLLALLPRAVVCGEVVPGSGVEYLGKPF